MPVCSAKFLELMEIEYFFRFDGTAAEPRKGIKSGHVPGSKCIPFPQVNDQMLYGFCCVLMT